LASSRDLVRRIRSVKGTQQITKAMKMVAAAKLRRAQEAVTRARPYADTMARVLASLASRTEHTHPMLESREGSRARLVVISSDKGLCGSFNANLLREATRALAGDRWDSVDVVAIGRKASDFFRRRDYTLAHEERDTITRLSAEDGPRLGEMFTEAFTSDEVDEVWLVYNKFINLIRQEITVERLLPIEPETLEDDAAGDGPPVDYLYEPSAEALLESLLPRHVQAQVQRCLYDSAAAEQAARMTSMDAATKNAGEMIENLTLLYNRTRQAGITKELLEIVAGAQALAE
jgi:F-type H+-transporting ATPase subunit gamma